MATAFRLPSAKLALASLLLLSFWLTALPAKASTLVLDYTFEFSGGVPPGGTPPWMQAVFDDFGGSGSVRLTMTTLGLTSPENVIGWYFNLDPALDPNSLVFSYNGGLSTVGAAVSIDTGVNCCKADGDGRYDFRFNFTPATGFPALATVVYDISLATITASSFDFLSQPAGGHGPFVSAAHVQNTGDGDSGWVANSSGSVVPVPAAVWLFGSGLGLLALARRRVA